MKNFTNVSTAWMLLSVRFGGPRSDLPLQTQGLISCTEADASDDDNSYEGQCFSFLLRDMSKKNVALQPNGLPGASPKIGRDLPVPETQARANSSNLPPTL